VETFNEFAVSVQGGNVVILMSPRCLTGEQAMRFAAWLVTMADIADTSLPPFGEYLNAVQST
jgi:hypothetical protein